MPSSSRLIALVQLIRKWGHKLNLKRGMEMLKLMWECLRVPCVLQRVSELLLIDALAKRWIYLGVMPPIKFNCFPWGSPVKRLLSQIKGIFCMRMYGKYMAIGKGQFHVDCLDFLAAKVMVGTWKTHSQIVKIVRYSPAGKLNASFVIWQMLLVVGNLYSQHFYRKKWATRTNSKAYFISYWWTIFDCRKVLRFLSGLVFLIWEAFSTLLI